MAPNKFRALKMGKETFYPISDDENGFTMDWSVEKGGGVPPHLHKFMDEKFVITKGEFKFKMNGETIIKKAGDEHFVPKGCTHSVKNVFDGQSAAHVTFSPSADTGKLFEIVYSLDESNPGKVMNMIKAIYITHKLGLREFSTPQPEWVAKMLMSIVKMMAGFSQWNKLVEKYRHQAFN